MGNLIFKVDDMTCNGCASNIRAALEGNPAVNSVVIDLEKKRVQLTTDLDRDTVKGIIQNAGYTPSKPKRGFLSKLFG